MLFIDREPWNQPVYSTVQLAREWNEAGKTDPDNYPRFNVGCYINLIMDTVNGRNNLEIIDRTPREIERLLRRLWAFHDRREHRAFIAGTMLGDPYREPLTVEDAACTLREWTAEGIEIPPRLTPEIFAATWNEFIESERPARDPEPDPEPDPAPRQFTATFTQYGHDDFSVWFHDIDDTNPEHGFSVRGTAAGIIEEVKEALQ